MEQECVVCLATTPTGLHYGATTCYPCRAFFRRVPERKRQPVCKRGGVCEVEGVTKHCSGCRFQKCLRSGMQLSQVLSQDQRKERFSSSLRRKRMLGQLGEEEEEVHSDSSPAETQRTTTPPSHEAPGALLEPEQDESPRLFQQSFHPPMSQVPLHLRPPLSPLSSPQQSTRPHLQCPQSPLRPAPQSPLHHSPLLFPLLSALQPPLTSSPHSPLQHSPRSPLWPLHQLSLQSYLRPHLQSSNQSPVQRPFQSSIQSPLQLPLNSALRPPLQPPHLPLRPHGALTQSAQALPPPSWQFRPASRAASPQHRTQQQQQQRLYQAKGSRMVQLVHDLPQQQSPVPWSEQHQPITQHENHLEKSPQDASAEFEQYSEQETNNKRPSVIQDMKTNTGKAVQSNGILIARHKQEDTFIINATQNEYNKLKEENLSISSATESEKKMISRYVHKKFDRSTYQPLVALQRKSVIVSPTKYDPPPSPECEEITKSQVDEDEAALPVLQSIPSSSITRLLEEVPYMEERLASFFNSYHSINIGEENMRHFISFARHGIRPPRSFVHDTARQFRERYVSGACALNLVDIQEDLLHNALQTKLPLLHMLGYVAINSLTSLADSVAFLLSFQDRIQWQVEASDVEEWPSAELMLRNQPAPGELKEQIATAFLPYKGEPIFFDRSIHMLMVALVLFDSQDRDGRARAAHQVVLGMLRAHLHAHSTRPGEDLAMILRCITKDLPYLATLFTKMSAGHQDIQPAKRPRLN